MVPYLMRIIGDRMMLTGSIETLFCTCDTDLLLAIELKRADEQFMNKVTTDQEFWYWYFVFFNDFAEAELKKNVSHHRKKRHNGIKEKNVPSWLPRAVQRAIKTGSTIS